MAVKLLSKYNTITEALGFNLTAEQAKKFGFNPLKRTQDTIETVAAMYNYDTTTSTLSAYDMNGSIAGYTYRDTTKSYFFREFDDLKHEGLFQAIINPFTTSSNSTTKIPACTCSGRKITGTGTNQPDSSRFVYKNNSIVSVGVWEQLRYNTQKWIGDYGKTTPYDKRTHSYTHAFVDQRTEILKTVTDANSVITGFKDFKWSNYKQIMLWDDITNGNAKLWGCIIPNYSIFLIAKDDTIKANLEANISDLYTACQSIDTYDEIMMKITGATSKTQNVFYNGVLIGYRVGLYIYIFPPTTGLHYVFYSAKNNGSAYPLTTDSNGNQYIDWDNIDYNTEYTEALGVLGVDPRMLDKLEGMYYIDCDEYNPKISTIEVFASPSYWSFNPKYVNTVPNNIFPQLIIESGQNSGNYYLFGGPQSGILRYNHRQNFTDEQYNTLYAASQKTTMTDTERQQILYYIVTNFVTITNPTFDSIIEYVLILNVTQRSFDVGWRAPMIFTYNNNGFFGDPKGDALAYDKNTILGSHTFTYTTNDPTDVLQTLGISEPFSTTLTISVDDAWVQMSYVGLYDQSKTNVAVLKNDTLTYGSTVAPYAGEAIINPNRFSFKLDNIYATTRFALTGSTNLIPGGYQEFNVPVNIISDKTSDIDFYNTSYNCFPPLSVYEKYTFYTKVNTAWVANFNNFTEKINGLMIKTRRISTDISDTINMHTIGIIDIYYESISGTNGAIYPYNAVGDEFTVTSYPKQNEFSMKYFGVSEVCFRDFTASGVMYNLLDFATITNVPKNSDGTYNFSGVTSLVFAPKASKSYKPSRYTVRPIKDGIKNAYVKLGLGTKQTIYNTPSNGTQYTGLFASWKRTNYYNYAAYPLLEGETQSQWWKRVFVQDDWLEIVYNTNSDTYSIDLTGMSIYLNGLTIDLWDTNHTFDSAHVETVFLMVHSGERLLITGQDY